MTTIILLPVVLLLSLFVFQADGFFFSNRLPKNRDCIIKPWSKWGLCQSTPRGYIQQRTRNTLPPRNRGKACPKEVLKEKTCNSGNATSSLIRAAIGSLATVKSFPTRLPPFRRIPSSGLNFKIGATNPNKTSRNANGDTCSVLKDPSSGKILAAGNCKSTRRRTSRSIKESLTSYFNRVRRQILEPNRDVLFLIDRSGSILDKNMQKSRDMAAGLINLFCGTINLDHTRVGVATFNGGYQMLIRFDKYLKETQKKIFIKEIRELKFTSTGATYMGEALKIARKQTLIDDTWGARQKPDNIKKMIFLITDGCSNGQVKIEDEALELQKADIDVFVVQVGLACATKMMSLDGGDFECFNALFFDDWISFNDAAQDFLSDTTCSLNNWEDLHEKPC